MRLVPALGLPLALLALPAVAADWNLAPDGSGDFPTIQAAMDAAEPGDRILLAPGIYRDAVEREVEGEMLTAIAFLRPGVSLIGESPFETFLDGEEDHRGLVGRKLDKNTRLAGFTLLHCDTERLEPAGGRGSGHFDARGGGILLLDAAPVIENVRFVGCNAGEAGAGLYAVRGREDDPLTVTHCAFVFCWSRGTGGGIEARRIGSVVVVNNTFCGNFADKKGGAVSVSDCGGSLDNNVFWYNCSHEGGGALWCAGSSVPGSCNLFWENFPEVTEPHGCGVEPGRNGNVVGHPRFCDADSEDYSLDSVSAAAPDNSDGCGLIGAYPVACGEGRHGVRDLASSQGPLDADDERALVVAVTPNPARGAARLAITSADRTVTDRVTADVTDVRGRRVTRLEATLAGGQATLAWDGRDSAGRPVADGIYLARVACGQEDCTVRIVMLR